jgi:hypothetical protein
MNYLILLLLIFSPPTCAETVYKFANNQGNIEFSNEKPPVGVHFEVIDMETRELATASPVPPTPMSAMLPLSAVAPGLPVADPPAPTVFNPPPQLTTPPATSQPLVPSANANEPRYQQIKKDLTEICDHLNTGSTERRKCRTDAKQIFHDKCHDKDTPVSELYRSAYCSLSDSYSIGE